MVIFGYQIIRRGKSFPAHSSDKLLARGFLSKEDAMRYIYETGTCAAWNKLYRRTLFNIIRYPEGYNYEDLGTTYKLVHAASSFFYDPTPLYQYRVRHGSITQTRSKHNTYDMIAMMLAEKKDLEAWGYITADQANKIVLHLSIHYLVRFGRKNTESLKYIDYLEGTRVLKSSVSRTDKLLFILYKYFPHLFDALCIVTGRRVT